MLPLQNYHVNGIDNLVGSPFKEVHHVRKIASARDSICNEMCQQLNITDYKHIQAL